VREPKLTVWATEVLEELGKGEAIHQSHEANTQAAGDGSSSPAIYELKVPGRGAFPNYTSVNNRLQQVSSKINTSAPKTGQTIY